MDGIRWTPAKPVVSALESPLTDILLILSTVLFTGSLVLEEKQKALILVTRSTKYGLGPCSHITPACRKTKKKAVHAVKDRRNSQAMNKQRQKFGKNAMAQSIFRTAGYQDKCLLLLFQ